MVTTHLRIAAGVCALSIGLLVGGGGAVALADGTDAGGSSTGNQDGTIAGGPGTPPTDGPTSAIGNQRADEEPGQNVTKLNVTKLAVSVADPIDGQGPTSTMEAQTYSSGDAQEGTGTGGSKLGRRGRHYTQHGVEDGAVGIGPACVRIERRPAGTACACVRCEPAHTGTDRSGRTGAPAAAHGCQDDRCRAGAEEVRQICAGTRQASGDPRGAADFPDPGHRLHQYAQRDGRRRRRARPDAK